MKSPDKPSPEETETLIELPIGGENVAEEQLIPQSTSNGGATKKRSTKKGTRSDVKRRVRKTRPSTKKQNSQIIKYSALFLLVAQMVGLVLLMRYTRTHRAPDQPLYLASTAVFCMEAMKFIICCIVIAHQSNGALLQELTTHVWNSPMEMAKLSVPSVLYTIQNNLLYLALTNLDAATYQVCYQLKILTTALFSAILLQRKFSTAKWISLVILTIGVAIVQVSGSGDYHTHNKADEHNRLVGLVAVLCAACTSGFSGVYFEKILKGSQTSLWIRNVQMGLPSIIVAYITVLIKDSAAVAEHGFFGGYNSSVWTVVTVQAAGGLIVAVVVKYADNVLKVFATSFSIVISCIISALLFDFHANAMFVLGASLVVLATVMYSKPAAKRNRRKPELPLTQSSTRKSAA